MGVWLLSQVNPSALVSPREAASHLKSLYREIVLWDILEALFATGFFYSSFDFLLFPFSGWW